MSRHYYGNGKPVNVFRNQAKIAGYHTETKSGESVTFDDIYNDIADVEVQGNTVQLSDWYEKTGLSSQAGTPTPESPIEITSNLPAGTYKYTAPDGIYEFTIDEELRGIGTALDKIVFDRVSHSGVLERRCKSIAFTGSDAESWFIASPANHTVHTEFEYGSWLSGVELKPGSDSFVISNRFSWVDADTLWVSDNIEGIAVNFSGRIQLCISNSRLNTIDVVGFKTWILLHPFVLYYKLAAPTRTPLTFTKVSSSSAPECPMTFLTNTPSLDYPADVVDASGNVISHGKNLFDKSQSVENVSDLGNNVRTIILKPNTAYMYVSSPYTGPITLSFYDFIYNHLNYGEVRSGHTLTTPANCHCVKAHTAILSDSNIQIEEGSVATPYEPFKGNTTIPLPELRKVGAVSDSYVPKTGVKTKRIEKIASYAGESITTPYLSTTGALTAGATVLYELATPATEQYTPAPVPTYYGQTVIETDSTVKPTITATAKVPD